MKPHEQLFLSRHITMGWDGVEKVIEYLADYLPAIFSHPAKTMDDGDRLSFLRGVLQVYLEFWNATGPVQEYVPDFTRASRCLEDECANIITQTVSLLKHIRSCQYLANINTVEKMDQLQKLNTDFISILDEYFKTNIWVKFINKFNRQNFFLHKALPII